ncbi:hypothetical protein PENTCL1PPCAC_9605, partial [Pristionchus entomophagus]
VFRMSDHSKFVLRWEIDNAKVRMAVGEAESKVFKEGGFEWTAGVRRNRPHTDFTLVCKNQRGGEWKCQADVELEPLSSKENWTERTLVEFNHGCGVHVFKNMMHWAHMTTAGQDTGFIHKDKIVVEFRINIISAEGRLSEFSSPNETGNVTLVIKDNKFKVSKEFLAFHSPVFSDMFFGNFDEKGKEEVEIKDIIYEEFLDLLCVIFPGTTEIRDRTVLHILKLADQFQMKRVMDQSQKHLIQSEGFDAAKKLLIADQYRLFALRDHCFNSFAGIADLMRKMKLTPGGEKLSAEMKVAIYDRYY